MRRRSYGPFRRLFLEPDMDTQQVLQITPVGKGEASPSPDWSPAERIPPLLAQARVLHAEEPARALRLAEEALTLAGSDPSARLADCLLEAGICHRWLTRYDEALACLDRALRLSRERPDPVIELQCLGEIALIRAYQADYPAQIENALRALAIARAVGDESRVGKLLQYVGVGYFELADYAAALPYYLEALDEAEQAGRGSDLSFALHNIAGLYRIMGDAETGRLFSEKCLQAARESATAINEAGALCQISEYLSGRGEYAQALEVSGEALSVARRIRQTQPSAELNVRQSQGQAYAGLGQWPEAIACFQEALKIAGSSQDRRYESIFLQELAAAYRQEGRRVDARAALEQALAAAEEAGARQHVYTAHRDLGKLCQEEGDLAGALAHAEAYHAVEREVRTAEADNRAKALAVRMQVEAAKQESLAHQRDAELHRLRNVELAAANRTLQQQAALLQAQAEEMQAQAEELRRRATEDGLTGLYNRRYLEGALARQFHEARRSGAPLAVAMADVDHFKGINDRFGHQIGDEVLMTVAHLFREACRASDVIARYGGEEFALALPGTDLAGGVEVCERVRRAVQTHTWAAIHPALGVTVSLGVSADPSATHHERLLGLADEQLYAAKRAGRNRVCAGLCPHAQEAWGRQPLLA